VSAFRGANLEPTAALGQFLKQVEGGQIPAGTTLICESLDRLSREKVRKALTLFLNLIDHGIEIVCLADNERKYTAKSVDANSIDLITSILVMSRANEESATKSTRIKAAWLNKNKDAQAGKHIDVNCPAWLENTGTSYKLIPEMVAVIKRITDLYLSGLGCLTISGILNNDKVPVISTAKKRKTATWHPYQISRLLNNKALIGTYVFVDPEIPDFYPSAISSKTFFAAQAKLNERPKYKGQRNLKPYLFSGLMKCKQCGGTLYRTIEKGYSYIECMNRKDKQGCTCAYQNYPATERAFLNTIAGIDSAATEPDEDVLNAQKDLDALQGKLLELQDKIKAASDIFRKTPSDSVSLILQQFEVEKMELEQQISQKRNITFLHDHRRDWREVKAKLEKQIRQEGSVLEVIPVSLYMEDGQLKKIRHEDKAALDPIALRENIRSYIRDIVIDTDLMRSEIRFKSGKSVLVEMHKTNTRPIKYSYKVDGDKDWIPINL
jgi:DNA invertase Pin-like site-specific DNA recombinase